MYKFIKEKNSNKNLFNSIQKIPSNPLFYFFLYYFNLVSQNQIEDQKKKKSKKKERKRRKKHNAEIFLFVIFIISE